MVICMGRLFYFCAISIFYDFLKGICTSLIKSTHSKKQTNKQTKPKTSDIQLSLRRA